MPLLPSILLILSAAGSRIISHVPGFTALGAVSVWSFTFIRLRWLAFLVPILALLVSDAVLGFTPALNTVYLPFLASALVGCFLGRHLGVERSSIFKAVGVTFFGGGVFFLMSNFGVWLGGQLYPRNFAGLVETYAMAIPFYRNQFLADFLFGVIFFLVGRASSLFMPRTLTVCSLKKD